MKLRILAIAFAQLLVLTPQTYAVDTDGDGLLDLMDVPGFDPDASGWGGYSYSHIEDLDGANQLTNLETLVLTGNQITSIESGDFSGLGYLRELGLAGNKITSIESGDFAGLENLQRLGLNGNQITSIESGDFAGPTNLKYLSLQYNQITSIESGDFAGLDDLQTLSLHDNQLTSIESGYFAGLDNLQRLYLTGNQVTGIESGDFAGLDSLQSLSLSGNQLTSIKSGDFAGLDNLELLWLHGNQLTSIKNGDLAGLKSLQTLWLNGNQLTSIESGAFAGLDNLRMLRLYENQLTELNFSLAELSNLSGCGPSRVSGFCADAASLTSLLLDDATLSIESFGAITSQTPVITDASLIGLRFSGEKPSDLSNLLATETLDIVTVDQGLFDTYVYELNNFAAMDGNTLTVIGYGDANLDGEFNTGDLVEVFAAGEYEDGIAENSYWTEGDWNSDGDFDSSDLVVTFRGGHYEQGPAINAVPEPSTAVLLLIGVLALVRRRASAEW